MGFEETKPLRISKGSLGFIDEVSEAGLCSSWGGFTNPLLIIANIFALKKFDLPKRDFNEKKPKDKNAGM